MGSNSKLPIPYIDLAHSLRAPLTVLRTQVALSKGKPPTLESWRETNDTFDEQIMLLSGIIDDVDILMKAENGDLSKGADDVNVTEAVESTIAANQEVAKGRDIKLSFNDASSQLNVQADKSHIERIVQRMIDNSLRDGATKVELTVDEGEVKISDDGLGTAVDQTDLSSKTPKYSKRTSIGLMAIKTLSDLYGYKLEISTGPNGSIMSLHVS